MAIESTPSSVRTNSPGRWHLFYRKLPAISTSLREATFVLGLLVLGIANCKLKDVQQRRTGQLGKYCARGLCAPRNWRSLGYYGATRLFN